MHNIPYDLFNHFNRQHLISMGQMSLVVPNYKQALYGPKGPFKQKNPSENTDTKERNKVGLSTSDGTLWLL